MPVDKESAAKNGNGHAGGGEGSDHEAAPPTSDELSDRQLATGFTHRALSVRAALLKDRLARKRVLILLLHEKVRSEAIAVSPDANAVTLHAEHSEGFVSPAWKILSDRRAELDPFAGTHYLSDTDAYEKLREPKEPQLDKLIELLTVSAITTHLHRGTALVSLLAAELKIDVRRDWTPDAAWLASYQKCQLAHLLAELQGTADLTPHLARKKSELVDALATLFADARDGKLKDETLASRVNGWLPVNLREQTAADAA